MHSGGSDQTTVNCIKKRKGSVKISTTIYKTSFSIHFHFLLHLLISNLKIISCYHSTFNLCTTSMTSYVEPRTVLDSVKSSTWKFFKFQVAGGDYRNIWDKYIYRQYIANISPIYRQYIGTGYENIFWIYRQYIGTGCTRSAGKFLKVASTNFYTTCINWLYTQ